MMEKKLIKEEIACGLVQDWEKGDKNIFGVHMFTDLNCRAKSSYDDISKDKMSSKSINLLNYLVDHPNVKIVAKEGSKNYPTVIYLSPQNPGINNQSFKLLYKKKILSNT